MLLAVEGGGFFSSSSSGYSKGLTLLLSGRKAEEKPMRVAPSPWNHYLQLVEDRKPDIQLASGTKKGLVGGGCVSFTCFGRAAAAAGLDSPSELIAGPNLYREISAAPPSFDEIKDGSAIDSDDGRTAISVKSSLKKRRNDVATVDCNRKAACVISRSSSRSELGRSVSILDDGGGGGGKNDSKHRTMCEKGVSGRAERRTVQWTDTNGGELFEVREFEMSEDDSDDEFDPGNGKTCLCRIM